MSKLYPIRTLVTKRVAEQYDIFLCKHTLKIIIIMRINKQTDEQANELIFYRISVFIYYNIIL